MNETLVALAADSRLSDPARVLAFYIASRGEDFTEISHDEFAGVLHGSPTHDTIRRHLRQLVKVFRYVEREPGGGGHSDRYRISPVKIPGPISDSPVKIPGPTRAMVVEDGGALTPVVPLRRVSPDAEQAIEQHAGKLHGCRDAMRDYLRKRVPASEHRATVQTVATWLDGFGFNWRGYGGAPIPGEHHPGLLAAAFNELAATDEKLYKYPPGDIRNIKTKLNILCGDWGKKAKEATGTDGRSGRGKQEKQPLDAQTYTPTTRGGAKWVS